MCAIASQITSLTIVYSTVYWDADQRKHQGSASLAFVWGIHRGPVNSPHKWPVTRKMFPFDDGIMKVLQYVLRTLLVPQILNNTVGCRGFEQVHHRGGTLSRNVPQFLQHPRALISWKHDGCSDERRCCTILHGKGVDEHVLCHKWHGVSNQQQLDSLFRILLILTTKKHQRSILLLYCERIHRWPAVIHLQRY